MKRYNHFIKLGWIAFLIGLLVCIYGERGYSAAVDEAEAIAVADLWYAMELNSSQMKMDATAREVKLDHIASRQVLYLVEGGDLLETTPVDETVLAYVVTYDPSGFVVVTADDRILPIVAFDATTTFRWDRPERNFLRHFLQKNIPARWQHMRSAIMGASAFGTHSMWGYLRSKRAAAEPLDTVSRKEEVPMETLQWETANWDQGWPYNTTVVAHNGDTSVPTGCTATAMAIKMRFHSWPNTGNGSNSYTDSWGSVQYSHSVNLGSQTYNWSAMPTTNLTSANQDVADLMYHCGVSTEMDYEVGGSGAWLNETNLDTHFRYRGTIDLRSGHETPMSDSILAGLPVILSSSTHTVVADGYRDDLSPYFHINAGWGGSSNGWYNLDQVPGTDKTVDRSYPYSSPNNYTFVDNTWSGTENGNLQNPYNTVSEGYTATPTNGQLYIRSGSYSGAGNVPMTFDKAMTVHPYRGSVTIGN